MNVTYHGPDWLTGGPRGTEASALVFPILALLFVALARAYPRPVMDGRVAGRAHEDGPLAPRQTDRIDREDESP
jgi:hypothetical protein